MTQTTVRQTIGPWVAEYAWPHLDDQGEPIENGGPRTLTVRAARDADPADVARGISSTVLRQLDFTRAAEGWRELRAAADVATNNPAEHRRRLADAVRRLSERGVVDDAYLANLASAYVALVRRGEPSVTAALAEMAGRQPDTIRLHLKRARKAGLLTTVKGKAGGQLTDRAWQVLGFDGA